MSNHTTPDSWATRQRLAWVQAWLGKTGSIQRKDIAMKFGMSLAQASADLQAYQAANPGALTYDLNAKCYRPALPPREIFTLERWEDLS